MEEEIAAVQADEHCNKRRQQ